MVAMHGCHTLPWLMVMPGDDHLVTHEAEDRVGDAGLPHVDNLVPGRAEVCLHPRAVQHLRHLLLVRRPFAHQLARLKVE